MQYYKKALFHNLNYIMFSMQDWKFSRSRPTLVPHLCLIWGTWGTFLLSASFWGTYLNQPMKMQYYKFTLFYNLSVQHVTHISRTKAFSVLSSFLILPRLKSCSILLPSIWRNQTDSKHDKIPNKNTCFFTNLFLDFYQKINLTKILF